MAGLRQPGSSVSKDDITHLAALAGVDQEALDALVYRPSNRFAHHRFLGSTLHREFIDLARRRACPRCLAEGGYHRAQWDCGLLTACPQHAIRLITRCQKCQRSLDWHQPLIRHCRCGTDLGTQNGTAINGAEVATCLALVSLFEVQRPTWLPSVLQDCESADVVRLAMCLGMFLTGWRGERRVETLVNAGAETTARVLQAGIGCLEGWPSLMHTFLREEQSRRDQRRGRYGARKTLGPFYDWLGMMEPGPIRSALIDVAREFIHDDQALSRRVHRSRMLGSRGRDNGRSMALVDAATLLGKSSTGVKRMVEAGLLPGVDGAGRGTPMLLDREPVEGLASVLSRAVPLAAAARLLGISKARVRRLVAAELLTPVHGGPAEGWARWVFDGAEIERLLDQLSSVDAVTPGRTVGFDHAAKALQRRGVGIDGFVRGVLNNDLRVVGIDAGALGLKRLWFAQSEVHAFCRQLETGDHLTIEVAAERLGLKWEVVRHLVRNGLIESSEAGISLAALSRFQVEFISGAALASKYRRSPRNLVIWLEASGIKPIVGPRIDGSRQNIFRLEETRRLYTG